jgi:hypothetical protein
MLDARTSPANSNPVAYDGSRMRQPSDDNVTGREDAADAYTSERHAARSSVRLIQRGHHHIVS